MSKTARDRRWTGWSARKHSLLRPFPALGFEELESRLAPATFTWTGAGPDTNWNTPSNWVGNAAPTGAGNPLNAENLVFGSAGVAHPTSNNNILGGVFNSVTFDVGGYTITGNPLTLGYAASNSGFVVVSTGALNNTWAVDTTLGASAGTDQTFTIGANGAALTITHPLTGSTGSNLVKDGPGTLTLAADNSGFTGTIKVNNNGGVLAISHPNALGDAVGTTTVGTNAALWLNGVVGTVNERLLLNGPGVANDGALQIQSGTTTWAGSIEMDSDSVFGAATGAVLDITGQISDNASGHNLRKEGRGEVRFDSPTGNTYRGLTTINDGVLTVGHPLALGAPLSGAGNASNGTVVTQTISGAGQVVAEGQLRLRTTSGTGFLIKDELLTLNGDGRDGNGALYNVLGDNTWAAAVTLGSPAPDTRDVTIGAVANTSVLISGIVSSPNDPFAGFNNLFKVGAGRLILDNANTYIRNTVINGGAITIRDSKGLGSTAAGTTVNNGSLELEVDIAAPGSPHFDAHGRNLWIDSVTGNNPNSLQVPESISITGLGLGSNGALRNISGINQIDLIVSMFGGQAAIGVDMDSRPGHPTPDASYFVNDYSLTTTGGVSSGTGTTFVKRGLGDLILPTDNAGLTGPTDVQQGWITIRSANSLGVYDNNKASTVQAATTIQDGAAVHIKPLVLGDSLSISENFNLSGMGPDLTALPYAFLGQKGAIVNLDGDNTLSGEIRLNKTAGVGVEQIDPSSPTVSNLTITGSMSSAFVSQNYTFNATGSSSEFSQIIDTGANSGTITIDYDMYFQPDSLRVYYPPRSQGGTRILDTGLVSGTGTVSVNFGPGPSTQIEIVVNEGGNFTGTVWDLNNVSIVTAASGPGLVKLGSKRLNIQGDGTYAGTTEVREGTLRAQNDTALGTISTGTATTQESYATSDTEVGNGAVLELANGISSKNGGISSGIQVWNEHLTLNSPGQQVAVAGAGGTFTLGFGGSTTTTLPLNATPLQVQAALNDLPTIGKTEIQQVQITNPAGTFALAFGGAQTGDLPFNATALQVQAALNDLPTIGKSEVQQVHVTGIGGQFRLTFNGQQTAMVAFDAPATGPGSVQEALEALPGIGVGRVKVTAVGPPGNITYTVTFSDILAGADQTEMTGFGINGAAATVTTVQDGVTNVTVTQAGNIYTITFSGRPAGLPSGTLAGADQPPLVPIDGGATPVVTTVQDGVTNAPVSKTGNVFFVQFNGPLASIINLPLLTATPSGGAEVRVSGGTAPLVNLTNDNAWRGPVTLAADTRVDVTADTRLSLLAGIDDNSNLAGSDLVKRGLGQLDLAGTNTYHGLTQIDQGIVAAMNSSAFGASGTAASGTVVAAGAQVQLVGSITVAGEQLTLQGSGPAVLPNFPARWFNTGPAPTNNGLSGTNNLPTTGRVTSVASDPTDPNVIYVATAGGGIWKTKNGGQTWLQLFDDQLTADPLALMYGGSVVVATPSIIYFATGEANGAPNGAPNTGPADNFAGSGVYRSMDAGITWSLLTNADGTNPIYGQAVSKMIVDPTNPSRIYLSTGTRNVQNASPTAVPGVYRFDDSGDTTLGWVNLTGNPSANRAATVGQAPYDTAPPLDAGPDDDYRIKFPQSDATWSDLALVQVGDVFTGGRANRVGTAAGTGDNVNTFYVYAALGDSVQSYFTSATNQAVLNAVYRMEDPGSDNPTWWLGAGTVYPLAQTSGPPIPSPLPPLPPPTTPDARGTGYPTGSVTVPPAGPTSPPPGRNGWIKVVGTTVARYLNLTGNNGINPQVTVYGENGMPPWNNPGALQDIQKTGWDGAVATSWAATGGVPATPYNVPFATPPLGQYDNVMLIQNQNTVYLAGYNQIFQTTDGGGSWAPLVDATGAAPGNQFHSLYLDTQGRLLSGSDGGVWRWNGTNFTNLNGNLNAVQLNSADPHPTSLTQAYAGAQDSGTLLFSNNPAWERQDNILASNTGEIQYDPSNPAIAYAFRDGILRKTTDGGVTWVTIAISPGQPEIQTVSTDGNAFQLTFDGQTTAVIPAGANAPQVQAALNALSNIGGVGGNVSVVGTPSFNPATLQFTPFTVTFGGLLGSTNLFQMTGTANVTVATVQNGGAFANYFPEMVDPVDSKRVLSGAGSSSLGLFESLTGGSIGSFVKLFSGTVTRIGAAAAQGPYVFDSGFPQVFDQLSSTYTPDTIYITDGSTVRVTKNHGVTWISRPAFNDTLFQVTFDGGIVAGTDVSRITNAGKGKGITTTTIQQGSAGTNEIQTVEVTLSNGFFQLRFNPFGGFGKGQVTSPIPYNATSQDVEDALNALTGMVNDGAGGTGHVSVTIGQGKTIITDLTVDPSNRDIGYVTVRNTQGLQGSSVFRTTDAGRTWTDISGNLLGQAWSITVDPRSDTLYVGNEQGVWMLTNGSTSSTFTWTRFGAGMPEIQVRDVEINQNLNTLTAATYGRGMYQLFLTDPTAASGGGLRAVSGASTWTGPVVLAGDTTIGAAGSQAIQNGITPASVDIIGPISDDTAGANHQLVKVGQGTVTLSGTNTYGGQTLVQQGVLQVHNPQALGAPSANTVVTAGAALELRSDLDSEPITINGQGIQFPDGSGGFIGFNGHNTGALRNVSNNNTYTGPLTLGTNTTIGVDSGTTLTFGQKPGVLSGNGRIVGGSNFQLDKESTGTLVLASPDDYNGLTRVIQGALQVQDGQALGITPGGAGTVVLDGAQLQIARNSITLAPTVVLGESLTLSGGGINQTGALLNARGDTDPTPQDNRWAGPVTFNIVPNTSPATNPGSQVFIGVADSGIPGITDNLTIDTAIAQNAALASFGLVKVGAGRLSLAQANAYTGVTNVRQGTLRALNNNALGPVVSSEVQTVIVAGTAAGYTYQLQFNGKTTTTLNATDSAATVQAALGALTTIGKTGALENVLVSETPSVNGKVLTVTFRGPLANADQPQIAAVNLAGGIGVTTTTAQQGGLGTVVETGATLELGGGITVSERLDLNGDGVGGIGALNNAVNDNTYLGPITLDSDASIGAVTGTVMTVTGAVQDPTPLPVPVARLRKAGQGTVVFPTAKTYGGKTVIDDGVLRIQNPDALGVPRPEIQTIQIIASNGTFKLEFNGQQTGSLAFNVPASTGGAGGLTASVENALNGLSSIGGVGGSVIVTQSGPPGNVTYRVTFGGTLGNGNLPQITVIPSGGVTGIPNTVQDGSEGTTVNTGATLQLDIGNGVMTDESVTINGPGFQGHGALNNFAGNPTWQTPLILGSNAAIGTTNAADTLTFTVPIRDNGNAYNLDIVDPGIVRFAGTVDNQYTGTTTVKQGTLLLDQSSGLAILGPLAVGGGANPAVAKELQSNQIANTSPVAVNLNGTFDLNGQTDGIGKLTVSSGFVTTGVGGQLQTTGIDMTGGSIDITSATSRVTLQGNVTAVSTVTSAARILSSGGGGQLSLGGSDRTFTVTDGPQAVDLDVSAVLTGLATEGIVKGGTGRMAILTSGAYTGASTVTAGDLQVDATIANVRLAGGTVSGTGTVGTIGGTVGSAVGTVSPGDNGLPTPFGILHSGTATWGGATTFRVNLSSDNHPVPTPGVAYDQLQVAGDIFLNGATLSGTFDPSIQNGDKFIIIQTTGGTVHGTFAGSGVVFINGQKFTVSYVDPADPLNPNPANPTQVVLTKTLATVTVTVFSSTNPSALNQQVTFTATVTPEPGAGSIPITDTITFNVDGVDQLPAVNVDANGHATLTMSFATLGNHTIIANFSGDAVQFSPNSGQTVQLVQVRSLDPVIATPPMISPASSVTVQDSTVISTTVRGQSTPLNWDITVGSGANVKHFSGSGSPPGGSLDFPISVVWDGTDDVGQPFPEGVYTVSVHFSDGGGNSGTKTTTVTIDNTLPTATAPTNSVPVIAPGTAGAVPTSTVITATVGDPGHAPDWAANAHLSNWLIQIKNSSGTVVRTLTGTGTAVGGAAGTWDGKDSLGAVVPDGVYTVSVTAVDQAGNTFTNPTTVTVIVYAHPPAVTISPTSPITYGQSVTFTAIVSVTEPAVAPYLNGTTVQFYSNGTAIGTPQSVALNGGQYLAKLTVPLFNANTLGYSITAQFTDITNHLLPNTSAPRTQVVNPVHLTVTADSVNKPYGAAVPPLTFTLSPGLVGSDTIATVFTGQLGTAALQTSPVGSNFAITQNTLGLTTSNYTIQTFIPGTLTVTQAALNVVVNANQTKVYGAAVPTLTYTATGFQGSDTAATVLTGALGTSANDFSHVGPYTITQGTLAANGNYAINFTGGVLNVTPAPLSVAANPQSKVYGAAVPPLTYHVVSGLVGTDQAANVLTGSLTTTATQASGVGAYPISRGTLASNADYTLTFAPETLAVTPAALSIKVNDASRSFNDPNPTFTSSYTGFVNGDTSAVVSGLSLGTTAAAGSPVGTYPIIASGTPTAANYAITVQPGTLTVTRARFGIDPSVPPAPPAPTDVAVGSGSGGPGQVNVFSPSGSLKYALNPFGSEFTGGVRTAVGDFNGDGVADVVMGTGPGAPTQVIVIDGSTQQTLFSVEPFESSFTGGVFVSVGDIDGDGAPELLISPDQGGGPRVRIFHGGNFTPMADFFGIDDASFRGGARAAVGDVNGDGFGDVVVSAGFGGGPRVSGYDGHALTQGQKVHPFKDFFIFGGTDATNLRNGVFIAAGDVNGDGFADLIAGGGPGGGPRILVVDGAGLIQPGGQVANPLVNFFGGDPNNRGGIRVTTKDLDGDKKADIVVGAGDGAGSQTTWYRAVDLLNGAVALPVNAFDAFDDVTNGVFVG